MSMGVIITTFFLIATIILYVYAMKQLPKNH